MEKVFEENNQQSHINYPNHAFRTREQQVRAEVSFDEAVRQIEQVYHAEYDPDCGLSGSFDAWNQLLACEAVAESTPIGDDYFEEKGKTNEDSSVNGSVSDSYKHKVNFELTENKRKVITQLESCTYRTPPIKVALLLEEFFQEWPSVPNYWLTVVQKYTPRTIVRVIKRIVKQHTFGFMTVRNPASLFTFLIQKRAKRKHRL